MRIAMKLVLPFLAMGLAVPGAAQSPASYYVAASGSDERNSGLGEDIPFRTLRKAVDTAAAGDVRRIILLGNLSGGPWVFNYRGEGEILITGDSGVPGRERAFISIQVQLFGRFRFENLEVVEDSVVRLIDGTLYLGDGFRSRGSTILVDGGTLEMTGDAEVSDGSIGVTVRNRGALIVRGNARIHTNDYAGIRAEGGSVVLEENAAVSGNKRCGVDTSADAKNSRPCSLTLRGGASITGNGGPSAPLGGGILIGPSVSYGGGLVRNVVNMEGGSITGNEAQRGGGVFNRGGTFNMTGGTISGNRADYGGGLYTRMETPAGAQSRGGGADVCTLSGGRITGNTARLRGGGVFVGQGAAFTQGKVRITGNTGEKGGNNVDRQ